VRALSTPNSLIALALIVLLFGVSVRADVTCDGVDDRATTGVSTLTFASASTMTLTVWYKPTGTPTDPGINECWRGDLLLTSYSNTDGFPPIGLNRHPNFAGGDKLCAQNLDAGTPTHVGSTYSVNTWTHLALVHASGTLTFYKDGVSIGSTASGDTSGSSGPTIQLCVGQPAVWNSGQGIFAEAEVFNVALTAWEIGAKAKAGMKNVGITKPTGSWNYDQCANGANCNGVSFLDRSGFARPMTGDDGANNTGMSGAASSRLSYAWGAY